MTDHTTTRADPTRPSGGAAPAASRGWSTLVVLCLAQFMVILDITVVNVALPSIGADLRLSPALLTWAVTAYTLCFGGLLLLGGRLADAYGPRRTFLVGLTVFTIASVGAGLAQDGGTLIAGRMAQGAGAALLSPAALALVMTIFEGPQRHRALGVWAGVAAAGGAIGVVIGGALTEFASWRWTFLVNLPVGLAVGALVPVLVAVRRRPGGDRRIDLPGAVLATLATGLVIYGLVAAGTDGWLSSAANLALVGGLVMAAAFLIVERSTKDPLVPLGLLRRRSSIGGLLAMLVASGFMLSTFFLTSLVLQRVAGLSALDTGLVFLPVGLVTIAGTHIAVRALGRFGPAATATAGFTLAAAGALLLASTADDSWSAMLPGLLVIAAGAGTCFVTATTATMAGIEHERAGVMSALLTTGHELGASLGVAAVSAIAATSIGLTAGSGAGAQQATAGFSYAYLALAVAAAVMALAAPWLLPRAPLPTGDGPAFIH